MKNQRWRNFLIASLIILFVGWSQKTSHASQVGGELYPHFDGPVFRYVGDLEGDQLYIRQNEEGNLVGELADDQLVADVWFAQEETFILYKQPGTERFAFVASAYPKSKSLKPEDPEFHVAPADSLLAKAWNRASNPKKYRKDLRKGKTQSWVYVELAAVRNGYAERVHVGTKINKDSVTGLLFVPVLIVREQHYAYYIDPNRKRVAAIKSDLLGTPLEKMEYQPIQAGDEADTILHFIKHSGVR